MSNIKILYINKSIALLAGTERVLIDKMNYLAIHGYQVCIVTYEQGNHPIAFDLHPSIKHIDVDTRFFTLLKYNIIYRFFKIYCMKSLFQKRLKKIVNNFEPDIIVCTTYSLKIIDNILRVKGRAKTILESHTTMKSLLKAYDYNNVIMNKLAYHLIDRKYLKMITRFDSFVVLTDSDANEWKHNVRSIVIPNPITMAFKSSSENRVYKRILSVGRLEYEKGFDLLIKAFKEVSTSFPEWHLDIYGTGSRRKELLRQVSELKGKITIKEPVKNIETQYATSDFYVMSSRFEGFGMVLVEAMACGLPCVSFDCPNGPKEIINDGKDGLLAKNGDINDLASKINWMIVHENERKEMGMYAVKSAKRYNIDCVMGQWMNLFNKILNI